MKKQLIFLLLTILSFTAYAQIIFEKGYYITDSGQKTECLIRNVDWKNNPTKFEYKTDENSVIEKVTIKTVKEFGIHNKSKYLRSIVQIDRSSDHTNKLSNSKEPQFREEQLFLKVLVEGKATLFSYQGKSLRRYFYSIDNSDIYQLVYKRFMNPPSLKIHKNNTYRQQLGNSLKCDVITINTIKNINYRTSDLTKLFISYNKCSDSEYTFYKIKNTKSDFNVNIRPGISSSSLQVQNSAISTRNIDFGNKLNFRFGIEAEYVLPFNKSKWALIAEPTYQSYKSEELVHLNVGTLLERTEIIDTEYSSIELPIGLRHYLFLNNKSKLFINASYLLYLSNEFVIDFKTIDDISGESHSSLEFGVGYKQNDKYSLEIRYSAPPDFLNNEFFWESDYKTISVILGYTIF
ncbi:hypothetical protein AB832_01895 [Flavobacteriaceae bacterium (ex Bugula neritina AB1)]|nr:hypothetical protein AB832_01895 [Flavobacteriaceae bacterium (ex Bugula neritina AB1)]